MKTELTENESIDTLDIQTVTNDTKDFDLLVDKLFQNGSYQRNYRSEDIHILSQNISRAKRTIQELAKSQFPHPVTLIHLMKVFNDKFSTNFSKTSSVTYALKILSIDWHNEINKKLGLYNYDFLKYAENVKDETHKKQCLAMNHLKEGKSIANIAKDLGIKPSLIKKWFVSFVSSQKFK